MEVGVVNRYRGIDLTKTRLHTLEIEGFNVFGKRIKNDPFFFDFVSNLI